MWSYRADIVLVLGREEMKLLLGKELRDKIYEEMIKAAFCREIQEQNDKFIDLHS